ncbi:uncharacterized protein KIAA1958-like [Mercenaria mercenaria]|uniref:uncharacterized protein KIAA1958-like n=1 Tax=Mercenaria mercenaria TaxID=6596 RepID=UPI00234EC4B4|nr:uncharacterized protein KIAA1958-like [Mercenaria mercenaria]
MAINFSLETLDFLELSEAGFFEQLDENAFETDEVLAEINNENQINIDTGVDPNNKSAPIDSSDQASKNINSGTSKQPVFIAMDESDKHKFVQDMRNSNTIKKTETAVRQFQRWLSSDPRYITAEISDIPVEVLDNYIGSFLLSIRKADGSEYEPDTLTSYHRGIDRYLRDKNYDYSMVQDREFSTSRAVLASKRKQLNMSGKGGRPNAAQPLTSDEQEVLKEKKCIGLESPQQLLNKMWLNNTVMFGLRGGTESRSLCWGDVSLKTDAK